MKFELLIKLIKNATFFTCPFDVPRKATVNLDVVVSVTEVKAVFSKTIAGCTVAPLTPDILPP